MQTLLEKVDAVEVKARQLIHKIEQLERENEFLQKENNRIKKELKQYIDKIERLNKDQKEESFMDETNKVDFKQRIKHLTQEVEACIELLNS